MQPVLWLEFLALVFVGSAAYGNYTNLERLLQKVTNNSLEKFEIPKFAMLNALACLLGIILLSYSEMHVLSISWMYILFCFHNLKQIEVLSELSTNSQITSEPEFNVCAALGITWLQEENCPSVIAYTGILAFMFLASLIMLVVPLHDKIHNDWGWADGRLPEIIHQWIRSLTQSPVKTQLKAFAGGAATLHLVLSVLKYKFIVGADGELQENLIRKWTSELELRGVGGEARKYILSYSSTPCTKWKTWVSRLAIFATAFAILTRLLTCLFLS